MQLNIQKLEGKWKEGYALDLHTTSSTPIGVNAKGIQIFETVRPEIAEHLYQLKYRSDKSKINIIAREAVNFLNTKTHWQIHKIIPVPPSDKNRNFQPVIELAKAIGNICNLSVDLQSVKKIKDTPQTKREDDLQVRKDFLKDAFHIEKGILIGKNILLFDDLFRSGETMNAVSNIVVNKGNASNIYVLTITKTRSRK